MSGAKPVEQPFYLPDLFYQPGCVEFSIPETLGLGGGELGG